MNKFLLCLVFLLLNSQAFALDYSMQLHQIRLADLARIVYSDVLQQSYVLDSEVIQSSDAVSINWQNLSKLEVKTMTKDLLELRGFELVPMGPVLLVRKRATNDADLLIYQPRYRSARYLADILSKVADANPLGTRGMQASPEFQKAISKAPEVEGSASSHVDRSAFDQMAYQCMPANCKRLRSLLDSLDTPEAQVVLKAAVYEVGTTKGEGSALQIALGLLDGHVSAQAGSTIAGAPQVRLLAGGLDATLSVLDQDSRFKSVSRPMLRVRTGAQAKFSVGQQVPVLGSVSQDRNGNAVQSVDYRASGTIFTVQPDVRQEVIDLNVTQELSSFVATTTGVNNSPTLLQRTASSQLTIKPGEVVVFAGLEENRDDHAESRLFGLPIGKRDNGSTTEVLVFIEAQRI